MSDTKKKKLPLIIFSLIILFNPYVKVVDIFPDFIAYFIIAKLLERPADSAPYFEETRVSAVRLAWISLLKIPAFMLIVFIRSNNTLDSDVYAMATLIFAAVELLFLIPMINNLFSALFYLGERANASALITPFPLGKSGKRYARPEDLRGYTILFVSAKSVLSVIPELLLLSRTTDSGVLMPAPLGKLYPWGLIISVVAVIVLGIIWLIRASSYIKAIQNEGRFSEALSILATSDSEKKFETKVMKRRIKRAIYLIAIASIFTFPLALENTDNVNVFPGFLFTGISLLALFRLGTGKKYFPALLACGITNVLFSVLYLIFSAIFNTKYDYIDLLSGGAASAAYVPIMIFSFLEFISLAAYSVFLFKSLESYVYTHTGLSPESEKYSRMEATYHKDVKKRCVLFVAFLLVLSFIKCINVFISRNVSVINSTVGNRPVAITASSLPWFGTVICFFAIFFIGYSFYLARYLTEECERKYSFE